MLPAVIATLLGLVIVKRNQAKPEPEPPKAASEPEPVQPEPTPEPATRWTLPDPPEPGEIIIARSFMRNYLYLPHVQHVDRFFPHNAMPGDVKAYRGRYKTSAGDRLWQVCAIMTKYGHVYLSVLLNEYGEVAKDSQGVLVSYDYETLDVFIEETKAQQQARFGRLVYHRDRAIRDEDFLRFLIGDLTHPFSVSNCFM